ncbi:TPA: HK97 gp10 family phage protein [Listeria monocytogenes]|nr:HK97 gp10 family phage protein [Listeria monocytogenes]HBI2193234.1 HK97 gp10 family phage protein [Listeria monocytogenes]
MSVQFDDFSMQVKAALEEAAVQFLHEAAGELVSQTARNSPVDTGQLKGSWDYRVDESKLEATIGSPLENAIWNEYGTGEYAAEGNGRKGGWSYKDDHGDWHHTFGKKPERTFDKAYKGLKPKIIKRAEDVLKGTMK